MAIAVLERPAEVEVGVLPDVLDFTILPRHIAAGVRGSRHHCGAAEALLDDGWADAQVGSALVWASDVPYETSIELGEWIRRFDRGESVEPEHFRLTRYLAAG